MVGLAYMRKTIFANGEYYHIYNRGVDKRGVFMDKFDFERFLQSIEEFNSEDPIGSIYENSFIKDQIKSKKKKLVRIICYCLNPNHYHFIIGQLVGRGIEKFMHKLGLGYTQYFNLKHHRSGALFQGPFKAIHIDSNEYLLHLSAYVNLNFKVHKFKLGDLVPKWRSSWDEYVNEQRGAGLCKRDVILDQFKNRAEYKKFAESSLIDILGRKDAAKSLESLLLEQLGD
ncbi:MAG: Transposase [Candidatus Giovannonibacteria bacterium GW2011_GWC2_44_9]|uniref:Transposase n=2 Tax=Candidatus Giovannoniibacteriota TaxID=1752738 RepID=A0A0G1ITN0_9BACT|nr:MAG: Transposase [Candidatus Giovannonibacteria bacterium GW2011_GWA1_44_29]KKT82989.1 MAG: Transposase [Candidatus Giovannonibacteria bacterium GW2011_GWC2_44_9]KKT91138.1 MAG: Transposase [Parcubacteria group bacterium GW2011_GWC1_45_13]